MLGEYAEASKGYLLFYLGSNFTTRTGHDRLYRDGTNSTESLSSYNLNSITPVPN